MLLKYRCKLCCKEQIERNNANFKMRLGSQCVNKRVIRQVILLASCFASPSCTEAKTSDSSVSERRFNCIEVHNFFRSKDRAVLLQKATKLHLGIAQLSSRKHWKLCQLRYFFVFFAWNVNDPPTCDVTTMKMWQLPVFLPNIWLEDINKVP